MIAAHQLRPSDDPPHSDDGGAGAGANGGRQDGEDLPYKVEVWDAEERFVQQVVAVSVSPSIGFAAYYAAVREFPGRTVTLRHQGRVVSRWTGQRH